MAHFKEMNEEYAKWFEHKPARTCVAVKELPFGVPVSFRLDGDEGLGDVC